MKGLEGEEGEEEGIAVEEWTEELSALPLH